MILKIYIYIYIYKYSYIYIYIYKTGACTRVRVREIRGRKRLRQIKEEHDAVIDNIVLNNCPTTAACLLAYQRPFNQISEACCANILVPAELDGMWTEETHGKYDENKTVCAFFLGVSLQAKTLEFEEFRILDYLLLLAAGPIVDPRRKLLEYFSETRACFWPCAKHDDKEDGRQCFYVLDRMCWFN